MNQKKISIQCLLFSVFVFCISTKSFEQSQNQLPQDSTKKIKSLASKAAIRSAIVPGLGQAYNKKYWKIPLVYGVLAIPVAAFKYNSEWYSKTRFAYTVRVTKDVANYDQIARELQPLSENALRTYRNSFRKNMDFSVLGFLLAWGLNIVDATVDGHLRTFNITDDLTMSIQPHVNTIQQGVGLSATLHF